MLKNKISLNYSRLFVFILYSKYIFLKGNRYFKIIIIVLYVYKYMCSLKTIIYIEIILIFS